MQKKKNHGQELHWGEVGFYEVVTTETKSGSIVKVFHVMCF